MTCWEPNNCYASYASRSESRAATAWLPATIGFLHHTARSLVARTSRQGHSRLGYTGRLHHRHGDLTSTQRTRAIQSPRVVAAQLSAPPPLPTCGPWKPITSEPPVSPSSSVGPPSTKRSDSVTRSTKPAAAARAHRACGNPGHTRGREMARRISHARSRLAPRRPSTRDPAAHRAC